MRVRHLAHCGAAYWLSWLLIALVALMALLIVGGIALVASWL